MSFTLNHIALLLIALAIGWLLGLMTSGRGKYRQAWRDEQIAHRTGIKDRDARIAAANARIAELERHPAPVATGAAAGLTGAATAGSLARDREDLSRINGVSQAQEVALNEAGYQRYGQIAALNAEQEATLESRLGLKPGTIAREDWRGQAEQLARGEKRGLFGRTTTPV